MFLEKRAWYRIWLLPTLLTLSESIVAEGQWQSLDKISCETVEDGLKLVPGIHVV